MDEENVISLEEFVAKYCTEYCWEETPEEKAERTSKNNPGESVPLDK